jgi:hypothetical protein
MRVVPAVTIDRLQKLLRMLSSDKEHEALAAVGRLMIVLAAADLDIHDLADAVGRGFSAPQAPTNSRTNGHRTRSSAPDVDDDWHKAVEWCLAQPHRLRPREIEFLESLREWRGYPTEKQTAWLCAIVERLGR